ncbi:alpha/beta hydrolase [Actinoplanes sp. NPDC020271]|uniref:alpha/beta hydrolase n=1 Tax=Actinoplanes sp. NPDC020271 TaxID=3363896 RepID=UPI0037902530
MTVAGIPVVFIHGLWIHSSSWQPWIDRFAAAGYRPIAPGWPGDADTVEESRGRADRLAGHGLDDIAAHYGRIIDTLDQPPVVIGHSVGGLITQKLGVSHRLRAAVAISPAPIKGVTPVPVAQLRSSFPALRWPGNTRRAVALSENQFRYAFGNVLTAEESRALHTAYAMPGPARTLFEIATANLRRTSPAAVDVRTGDRAPLLIVAAEQDHTVPEVVVRAAHGLYRDSPAVADLVSIAGRGHSYVFDHDWPDLADRVERWLVNRLETAGPVS